MEIPDELIPYLKGELFGVIFSAIAYGIVIVLSGNCFHLLQKKRGTYSNRMRIILLIYVTVMSLLSTWTLIHWIYYLITDLGFAHLKVLPFEFPFIVWGADGFMVWRCVVLYQDVSKGLRLAMIILLSLLSFASFGLGFMALVGYALLVKDLMYSETVFILFSAVVNIILAALIVFRLIYHQRHVRNVLGAEHGSPYTNVMTMCVESSALMVITSGVYVALDFTVGNWYFWIPYLLYPHICVISPILIVYRVALGRAITPTLLPSEQAMAQIRFNIPLSNPSGQEGEV